MRTSNHRSSIQDGLTQNGLDGKAALGSWYLLNQGSVPNGSIPQPGRVPLESLGCFFPCSFLGCLGS